MSIPLDQLKTSYEIRAKAMQMPNRDRRRNRRLPLGLTQGSGAKRCTSLEPSTAIQLPVFHSGPKSLLWKKHHLTHASLDPTPHSPPTPLNPDPHLLLPPSIYPPSATPADSLPTPSFAWLGSNSRMQAVPSWAARRNVCSCREAPRSSQSPWQGRGREGVPLQRTHGWARSS